MCTLQCVHTGGAPGCELKDGRRERGGSKIEGSSTEAVGAARYNQGNVDVGLLAHGAERPSHPLRHSSSPPVPPSHASLHVEGVIILCVIMIHGLRPAAVS